MKTPSRLRNILAPFRAPVRRISPLDLERAKRLNIVVGAMGNIFVFLLLGAFLTGFIKELGASDRQVGLLATAASLGQIAQLPSSLILVRLRRRKYYWSLTCFTHRLLWTIVAFLPLFLVGHSAPDAVWVVIGIMFVSMFLANMCSPAWMSWMSDLVPEEQRGTFFGRRQGIIQAAVLVTMLLSGFFLDLFPKPSEGGTYLGYMILFGFGTLLGCIDVVLHTAIPEPPMEQLDDDSSAVQLILGALEDRDFMRLALISGAFTFGALIVNPFGVVYCLEDLEMSWSFLVSFLSAVNLPFAILGSFVWGWTAQRYGFRPVLIVTSVLGLTNLLMWFLVSATPVTVHAPGLGTVELKVYHLLLPIMNMVGGFVWSGHAIATFNLLLGLTPSRGKAVYLATYATIVGACSALGPSIAGIISDWAKAQNISHPFYFGVTLNYWHILLGMTAGCWTILIGFMFTIKRPQEAPVGFFVGQIVRGNPLRAFYHMATVHLAAAPEKRARVMRSLGETGSSLAVGELLAHLDDPDPKVRAEAVRSLGRLRDPSAVAALVERLRDPEGDLRILSARSLGMIGGQEAVEALIEQLHDSSREIRLEAVRALEALAPPSARESLLTLLTAEQDMQIRAAASMALSRMQNVDAIWEMIEVFRLAVNPIVRAEIAIAIGQLLSPRGDFYPLYRGERRLRGSRISRLMGRLRDRLVIDRSSPDDRAVARTLRRIEAAYVDGKWRRCARLLRALVLRYAANKHGLPEDAPEPVFYLLAKDWNLAACLHFMETLTQPADEIHLPPSDLEILLGVYFFWQVVRSPSNRL